MKRRAVLVGGGGYRYVMLLYVPLGEGGGYRYVMLLYVPLPPLTPPIQPFISEQFRNLQHNIKYIIYVSST